jgi:outer membrane protein TolC
MTYPDSRRLPRSRATSAARFPFILAAVAAAAVLTGCAVTPRPLNQPDVAVTARSDRAAARADVPPLNGSLSLNEAVARALKFNLQQRTYLMEQALSVGQLDLSRYDMLPKLVASAGYFVRDKDAISRSTDSVTGLPSLANPYISSDRRYGTFDLTLSWNVLDFGLSYYTAQQNADRVLIAGERRRKAMHVLVQDVRTAFWRAASAQKLQGELKATIAMAESALGDSRRVEAEKLRNPMEALRYQRTLLETLRVLESIEQELAAARIELAQLVNLDPASPLTLVEPAGDDLAPPRLAVSAERMEELAIANNADLREQFYNVRVAAAESRKALTRMFPNLNFAAGPKYNDNSYLINSQWNEVSAQVGWNLFNVFSAPKSRRLAEGGIQLAEQRRMAMQMAVLTQAYLARDLYQGAWQQLQRADAIWKIDQQIHQHSVNRETAQMQAKLERVSNNTAAIVSLLRRYQALSQVYAAGGKLQATLGLEPAVGSVDTMPLDELVRQVEQSSGQWLKSALSAPAPVGGQVASAEAEVRAQ